MFTGIVDHCGKIICINTSESVYCFAIQSQFQDLVLGESIAVEGVCLTVTKSENDVFYCDVSPETLRVTTLKSFKQHQKVNLERALQLSSRLGGHMLSGHVDQCAKVKSITSNNNFLAMEIHNITKENMCLLTKKGSIAVNGVSLTINEVIPDGLSVMLIPHTLEFSTLGGLSVGDEVNIEFDMIARIIVEQYKKYNI